MTKDPVCGMEVDWQQATSSGLCSDFEGKQYCFCSESCKQQFEQNPKRFAEQAA